MSFPFPFKVFSFLDQHLVETLDPREVRVLFASDPP